MKKLFSSLAVGLALLGTSAQAQADIININFSSSDQIYTGGAIVGSEGDTWNTTGTATSSMATLVNSDNTETNVGVSWTGTVYDNIDGSGFDNTDYINMMDDYLYAAAGDYDNTITFTGLTAGGTYELYVYSQGNDTEDTNNRMLTVIVNDTYYATDAAVQNADTFIVNQNYLKIDATADVNGTLVITYLPENGEANINALQLVDASPVPEPASLLLLGVGGAAAAASRKRRRQKDAA